MRIKLWGVRGSLPTPLAGDNVESKIRKALSLAKPGDISSEEAIESFIRSLPFSIRNTFGGNTTTIQVNTAAGDLIILDCGSGLKALGTELMKGDFGRGKLLEISAQTLSLLINCKPPTSPNALPNSVNP